MTGHKVADIVVCPLKPVKLNVLLPMPQARNNSFEMLTARPETPIIVSQINAVAGLSAFHNINKARVIPVGKMSMLSPK